MKNINPLSLFDDQFLNQKLNKLGNPLEKFDRYIDWIIFEQTVNQPFEKESGKKDQGGRPAFNRLMLFKALEIRAEVSGP